MSKSIFEIPELTSGIIINRPSKKIKTPYVADVRLIDGTEVLAHTPALGCCGLSNKKSKVYMIKAKEGNKCDYVVVQGQIIDKLKQIKIGIFPKHAEEITANILSKNFIDNLKIKSFEREKKILNSRFDFVGKTIDNKDFILEVKTVPLADYEDIDSKTRIKRIKETNNYENRNYKSKVAYFPDGYRKKSTDVISPRALKHIQELQKIKKENPDTRTILLFVIQRNDVEYFQPSIIDPIYRNAVIEAYENGVEIKTVVIQWIDNKAYLVNNKLPIVLYDNYDVKNKK
jgi:DNA-binding sugar fermentation-stimulating protein